MKKITACMLGTIFFATAANAQAAYAVTDTKPVTINGLEMGFRVKNKEERTVGDKGEFSRYALRFYITNSTNESKIILYKDGLNLLGNVSDQLVQFNILNATGARLTTKSAVLSAAPCTVVAQVEDNCGGKKQQNKRFVQIGYWIKAGQTISTDGIVIVPLNQQPNVEARYLANSLQPTASASYGNYTPDVQPPVAVQPAPQGTSKIRSMTGNVFINVETGILRTSPVIDGWFSAQWYLIPVPGTNYFNIKNRWKGHYIGAERGSIAMLNDALYPNGAWAMEPTSTPNVYRFKNISTNTYLGVVSGQIGLYVIHENDLNAMWSLE